MSMGRNEIRLAMLRELPDMDISLQSIKMVNSYLWAATGHNEAGNPYVILAHDVPDVGVKIIPILLNDLATRFLYGALELSPAVYRPDAATG